MPAHLLYLNNCQPNGCEVMPGWDDTRNAHSSITTRPSLVDAWPSNTTCTPARWNGENVRPPIVVGAVTEPEPLHARDVQNSRVTNYFCRQRAGGQRELIIMKHAAANLFDEDETTEVLDTLGDLIASPVVTIGEAAPLREVRRLLTSHRVPAVAVVDAQGALRGVITRTDVLRVLDSDTACAGEAMSGFVFAMPTRTAIEKAAALMAYEGVGQIVVTGFSGELLGMVSTLDITRHFAITSGYLVE